MPQVGMLRQQGEISGTAPELEAALIIIIFFLNDGNRHKQVVMLGRQGEISGTAPELEAALIFLMMQTRINRW